MKIKNWAIVMFSVGFGVMCFVWGVLWMLMAKDLVEKVTILERGLNNCELYTQQFE